MRYLLAALLTLPLLAQQSGTPVQVVEYPRDSPTLKNIYDGSGNLIYVCYTKAQAPNANNQNYNFSLSVSGGTLTSVVVATNVGTVTTVAAHGLMVGELVTISGATGDTDLNTTYIVATVPSSTTFTVTTSSVSDGTYNNSGLTLSGNAPLTTKGIWSIMKLNYDASSNMINRLWAGGNANAYSYVCDNSAVTTGANRIAYK